MIPPSYVKRVSVKNTSGHSVKVTASFGSAEQEAEGNAKIVETRELAADEEVTFDEHEYDMGSWTAVAALDSLHVEPAGAAANSAHNASFKPQVTGIVDLLQVEIKPQATGTLLISAV